MPIVRNDEVRSGKPVVKGTRVAVQDIVDTFYQVGRSVDEIAEDFGISEHEVEEALRYHKDSPAEVTA